MSKFGDLNLGGGDKTPLPAGQYGTSDKSGLEILSYIGSKETKNAGLFRHSFLVGSSNGTDGTAFLVIQLRPEWTADEAVALGFNKPEVSDPETMKAAEKAWYSQAIEAAKAANVPAEETEKWCEKFVENLKTQIRINVGTMFRLQDWQGKDRDPGASLGSLRGAKFSGVVEKSSVGESMEVSKVIGKKKEK